MVTATVLRKLFRRASREAPVQAPMVGWYDPGQLIMTGMRAVLSDVFGTRADYRVIQAISDRLASVERGGEDAPPTYEDRRELWIDYVADTGDGFASTYAIASQLGARELVVDGEGDALPRGDVLIMGGDQVYPTPTPQAYRDRLVRPFASAFPGGEGEGRPDLYALPGNHDWYDGLQSFTDRFCFRPRLGGWVTPQSRSYFALKLPGRVWLLGVDVQLESDIDQGQKEYFSNLDIRQGDRVILCTPEPDWVYRKVFTGETRLSRLEARLVAKGARVVLKIAGDQHHYRRHTLRRGGFDEHCHLITAGGGGAFLHPTHTHDVKTIKIAEADNGVAFELRKEYPDRGISRLLGLRNALFPFINPKFGLVTAIAYLVLSWVMPPAPPSADPALMLTNLGASAARGLSESPGSMVWVLLILSLVIAFTDAHRVGYRIIGGLSHGLAHMAGALAISAFTMRVLYPPGVEAPVGLQPVADRLALSAAELAGGYVIGSFIMGLYLLMSVVFFNMHGNEAFSSLRLDRYKNFLRMRVTNEGISVWAIGVDRVPAASDWTWVDGRWKLALEKSIVCKLIDDRIDIPLDKEG